MLHSSILCHVLSLYDISYWIAMHHILYYIALICISYVIVLHCIIHVRLMCVGCVHILLTLLIHMPWGGIIYIIVCLFWFWFCIQGIGGSS